MDNTEGGSAEEVLRPELGPFIGAVLRRLPSILQHVWLEGKAVPDRDAAPILSGTLTVRAKGIGHDGDRRAEQGEPTSLGNRHGEAETINRRSGRAVSTTTAGRAGLETTRVERITARAGKGPG